MEHRWGKRIEVDVPVTLRLASGELVPGRIANVSLSGAFIRAQPRLPWLGRLAVQLKVEDLWEGKPRTVWAHIVRQGHGGAGVEWAEFAPAAVCALVAEAGDVPAEFLRDRAHARA
jgi:hypothetical protein